MFCLLLSYFPLVLRIVSLFYSFSFQCVGACVYAHICLPACLFSCFMEANSINKSYSYAATNLFKMLLKYRPEDKAAKKERLLKEAQAKAEGKTVEAKKPIVVKYGLNHVTYLIEQVLLFCCQYFFLLTIFLKSKFKSKKFPCRIRHNWWLLLMMLIQ